MGVTNGEYVTRNSRGGVNVDKNELAAAMLEWGQKHAELALLTAEIESAVLELGKTQNVGNVRASYSGGRKSYDYAAAGMTAPEEIMAGNTITKTVISTDWKAVCADAGIDDIPYTQSEPSVTVKVVA